MSGRRPTLTFSLLEDLADYAPAERIVSVGVGPHDALIALLTDQPRRTEEQTSRVDGALLVGEGVQRELILEPTDIFGGSIPQPLPDGGVLLVETRRRGSSPNASVFDAEGRLSRRFAVGDGVEDVLVDAAGHAWVSYFDEGVVGNDPLSNTGLNAFDPTSGERIWAYSSDRYGEPILDCYALNVAGREAWAYYYTPFDLVHVNRDGQLERWTTSVRGAQAIALSDAGVLLLGTYGDWAQASLLQFGPGRLQQPVEVDVERPARRNPAERPALVSRSNQIYALYRGACFVGTVQD